MYDTGEMLEKYGDLVYKIAHKYYVDNPRFSWDDLVSQGQVAVIGATKSFDPSKQGAAAFGTFVYQAINNEVKKFVGENVFDLNVTEHKQRKEYKEKGNNDTLRSKNVAIRLDDYSANNSARGAGTKTDDITKSYDVIASGALSPVDAMIRDEEINIMREELYTLPPRERHVVEMRYLEGKTLQQIADDMKASKQTIHGWGERGFLKLQQKVKQRLGKEA